MYRNLYDVDCITWSPQGRIFQVEYAMEAVKQGTCCVGLRSDKYAVICSVKKSTSKLAEFHQKLFKIDDHIGSAMSGITADAKVMCNFMRNECLNHTFVYNSKVNTGRLVEAVADKCQIVTQRHSKRPLGVGLLVAGYDKTGPHIYETCPSGNYYESYAMAFGARSQASKTYLEKTYKQFPEMSLTDLFYHGAKALKASLPEDSELTVLNLAVGCVGKDQDWKELKAEELATIIEMLEANNQAAESMEIDPPTSEELQAAD